MDEWRAFRKQAYQIAMSTGAYKDPKPTIYELMPLPYDEELEEQQQAANSDWITELYNSRPWATP